MLLGPEMRGLQLDFRRAPSMTVQPIGDALLHPGNTLVGRKAL